MLSTYFTNSQNDLQGHLVTWKYPAGISNFPGGPYMLPDGPTGLDKKPGGPALYIGPPGTSFFTVSCRDQRASAIAVAEQAS